MASASPSRASSSSLLCYTSETASVEEAEKEREREQVAPANNVYFRCSHYYSILLTSTYKCIISGACVMTTLGGAASALLSSYWQPLSRSFSLRLLVSCNDCPLLRPPAGKGDTFDGTPSNSSAAASMRGYEIVRLRCFGGTVASSEEALVRRRLPLRKEPRCISLSIITASTTMYLLRIKGCGLASMLFFLGLSLLLTIQDAEAGMLMSKGIGRSKINYLNYPPIGCLLK